MADHPRPRMLTSGMPPGPREWSTFDATAASTTRMIVGLAQRTTELHPRAAVTTSKKMSTMDRSTHRYQSPPGPAFALFPVSGCDATVAEYSPRDRTPAPPRHAGQVHVPRTHHSPVWSDSMSRPQWSRPAESRLSRRDAVQVIVPSLRYLRCAARRTHRSPYPSGRIHHLPAVELWTRLWARQTRQARPPAIASAGHPPGCPPSHRHNQWGDDGGESVASPVRWSDRFMKGFHDARPRGIASTVQNSVFGFTSATRRTRPPPCRRNCSSSRPRSSRPPAAPTPGSPPAKSAPTTPTARMAPVAATRAAPP